MMEWQWIHVLHIDLARYLLRNSINDQRQYQRVGFYQDHHHLINRKQLKQMGNKQPLRLSFIINKQTNKQINILINKVNN